jgi:hypothetical protein
LRVNPAKSAGNFITNGGTGTLPENGVNNTFSNIEYRVK